MNGVNMIQKTIDIGGSFRWEPPNITENPENVISLLFTAIIFLWNRYTASGIPFLKPGNDGVVMGIRPEDIMTGDSGEAAPECSLGAGLFVF
jgi:hypothetical protein